MANGVFETMQERIIELENAVDSLQRQLFILAAAVGFDVVPSATEPEATINGKGSFPILTYDKLGLVERSGKLYRAKDAPKMTAPKKTPEAKAKTMELSADDIDLDELE